MKTYFTVHALAKHKNKYLLVKRASHRTDPNIWLPISGYVKDRESAEDAALRELKEETDLTGTILKTTEPFWADMNSKRWVVVLSIIKLDDIEGLNLDDDEIQDHKWVSLNDKVFDSSETLRLVKEKLTSLQKE